MIGRKGIIGLSLLCAMLFSALAAQGASAFSTTAVTCAPTKVKAQFEDPHCDNKPIGEEGFEHVRIPPGSETYVDVTNAKTASGTTAHQPAILTVKNFHGIKEVKITCEYITSQGLESENFVKNVEEAGGNMQVEGKVNLKYGKKTTEENANCTTNVPNTTAKVSAATAKFKGVEVGVNEMGLKFEPAVGTSFATITFEGGALNGVAVEVTGSVIGTSAAGPNGGGATLVVTPAMSSLFLGVVAAELSQTTTTSMTKGTTTENAIALTTNAA